jgi:hypothetical protein
MYSAAELFDRLIGITRGLDLPAAPQEASLERGAHAAIVVHH